MERYHTFRANLKQVINSKCVGSKCLSYDAICHQRTMILLLISLNMKSQSVNINLRMKDRLVQMSLNVNYTFTRELTHKYSSYM